MRARAGRVIAFCIAVLMSPLAASASGVTAEQAQAIVAAPDRSEADRKQDAKRHPAELLVFAGVGPGMRVADLGAGGGYTTELLARTVGESGQVYAQNSPYVIEKYVKESWPARLAKPVNAPVVRLDRERADVLPNDLAGLDVITMVYIYHDLRLSRLEGLDVAAFDRELFSALRPGGRLIIVDHYAKPGARGAEVYDELHRIDEDLVRSDLEAVGFRFDGSADFMRNREDPRDAPFFKMDGPTDTFVQRYVKPE